MSFLKLQGLLLNKRYIQRIEIKPNLFRIIISNPQLAGFGILGSGQLQSYSTHYEISKLTDPDDYQTVSDWIQSTY